MLICQITYKTVMVLFVFCILFSQEAYQRANSSEVTVPINITVEGKLIITDRENDNKAGEDPTLNVELRLTPDLNNTPVSGTSSIRIRTNLSRWKLTAARRSSQANLDPKDIQLSFTTQAGTKADPNSASLVAPFSGTTNLAQIPLNTPAEILNGSGMTSLERDPANKNNWFELTANYSIQPDFFLETGDWNTTISYNLVSP